MIRHFLLAILLAAIFAGLSHTLHGWLLRRMGGRRVPAALATLLLLLFGIALPVGGFLTLATTEAIEIGGNAEEWFRTHGGFLERGREFLARIPLVDRVLPQEEEISQYFQEVTGRVGSILWGAAAAATRGTASFLLQLFVFLYALFFFYLRGEETLARILGYLPLAATEKEQLLERFVSVARATLRGSLLIGVIQGGVAGLAFWAAGVPGAAFWGTVMIVFSILPAIGSGLVWVPAVIYLYLAGETLAAILLLIWCAVVVGSIDNLLRPLLIGKDARMSDLMILLSTLGGIALFGAVGFVVGPIVAALFVTVWQIYGEAFGDWLPEMRTASSPSEPLGDVIAGGDEGSGE